MALKLEASVNILWQNLIALNASLIKENEGTRSELLLAKEQLKQETDNSNALLAAHKRQQLELSKQKEKIAKLCSKIVAIQRIVSNGSDDENIDSSAATSTSAGPVIVKVESRDPNEDTLPENEARKSLPLTVNVCSECDKKFGSSGSLRKHMVLHTAPKFSCPKCPLTFARSDYVARHIKRAHDDGLMRSTRLPK